MALDAGDARIRWLLHWEEAVRLRCGGDRGLLQWRPIWIPMACGCCGGLRPPLERVPPQIDVVVAPALWCVVSALLGGELAVSRDLI